MKILCATICILAAVAIYMEAKETAPAHLLVMFAGVLVWLHSEERSTY